MEERKARRLAFICAVSGLFFLYLSLPLLEWIERPFPISRLTPENIASSVKVCGNVSGFRTANKNVFFSISDAEGSISVVVFNSTAARMNSSGIAIYAPPKTVCVRGPVSEYPPGSGRLEILARTVKV